MRNQKPLKPLRDRLGVRLLNNLRTRKITNAQAADELGVSESYLSRTVAAIQEKEPGETTAQRAANSELAKTRRVFRTKLAKEVLRRRKTIEDAAKEADCSIRTMFRYVERYRPQGK